MLRLKSIALLCAATCAGSTAMAETTDSPTVVSEGADHKLWDSFSLRLGLGSAGPVLFRDTPDGKLEKTSVFQFGGHLSFLVGHERKDPHRFGVGVAHNQVAKSESRRLGFVDAYAVYETGHPLILQAGLGANFATGTKSFADEYGGMFGSLALRYSFTREGRDSAISVSPGLVAKSYLVTSDIENSSFFVGAQIEIAYGINR